MSTCKCHAEGEARLTLAQYQSVMERIAGRAATLRDLLMDLQSMDGAVNGDGLTLLDAGQALAELIGLMADKAAGETVFGNVERWCYGPLFAGEGGSGHA